MSGTVFAARDLSWSKSPGQPVFSEVNFSLNAGDILVLSGKSGSGKSTLLKCLAHLNVYEGEVLLHGQTPNSYGIPSYRTRVLYVPQRPALLPSTPRVFLKTVQGFSSRKSSESDSQNNSASAAYVASLWGIEDELWDRAWSSLSGGEAQRMALAIAIGLKGTEILLLDEPTSALDEATAQSVEKYLSGLPGSSSSSIQAIVWVTHSEEQASAVATRRLVMQDGRMMQENGV